MRRFSKSFYAGVVLPVLFAAQNASAAVDSGVSTALTAVQADGVAIAGLVMPVVIALLGAAIGIKLVKRFGNKI